MGARSRVVPFSIDNFTGKGTQDRRQARANEFAGLQRTIRTRCLKMAKVFRAVTVSTLSNNGQSTAKFNKPVTLNINYDPQGLSVEFLAGTGPSLNNRLTNYVSVVPMRDNITTLERSFAISPFFLN